MIVRSPLLDAIRRPRFGMRRFAPFVTAMLLLAGCGGDGGSGATSSGGTDALVAIATPAPTPSPTPTTAATPDPTAAAAPVASNLHRASLLIRVGIPPSAKPDDVGAFRFICTAGQTSYDDPVVYPGVAGGSSHLHQFFGNTGTNYASTYASLMASGDSTCGNALNRSAYWLPALMTAGGQVIRPDYMATYYKRLPDGDPMCTLQAAQGCFDVPYGLHVVTGFDMKRMNDAQPENRTYNFRCISSGKPSDHHNLLADAIADCGGAGQIMAMINFGSCWDGRLDSADHRAHLVSATYVGHTYPECPSTNPRLIPTLTMQIAYTVEAEDGAVFFSSDHMSGMSMAGGSTLHADYMEGWEAQTREAWHRNCIGKLLNCSDGDLGDGTMMKRPALTYQASPRLASAPAR